eukprot:m.397102 g.397102  ORF g.397102 m.397102 type:complete len:612 (+) comp21122_c0_seq1:300-2135(+)
MYSIYNLLFLASLSFLGYGHVVQKHMEEYHHHRQQVDFSTGIQAEQLHSTQRQVHYNDTSTSSFATARKRLNAYSKYVPIEGPAQSAIMFVGDGMSIETVTAARIRKGQLAGNSGEESELSWEKFMHTGLSKTYNVNQQVPDSAGTITAMTTGVKTNAGMIGVGPEGIRSDCESSIGRHVATIAEWAKLRGFGVGIVTTTRVTHATPAGMYGHTPERDWEIDSNIPSQEEALGCKDLALQLVEWEVDGAGWDVVLGGGRRGFFPNTTSEGRRRDGRDLVAEWTARYASKGGRYVNTTEALKNARESTPLFGMFASSHMSFDEERDPKLEPSLEEMTAAALTILQNEEKFPKGYVLLVEGGRIDHAHHDGNWYRALSETIELERAVAVAVSMVDESETLITVTADHAHTTTFAGYPTRGNDILGVVFSNDANGRPESAPTLGSDLKTYTTLGYANGPGGGSRVTAGNVTNAESTAPDYLQQSTMLLAESETHGGQDVGVWAYGPGASAVSGTFEQNFLYFVVEHALELDVASAASPYLTDMMSGNSSDGVPNQASTGAQRGQDTERSTPQHGDGGTMMLALGGGVGMVAGILLSTLVISLRSRSGLLNTETL